MECNYPPPLPRATSFQQADELQNIGQLGKLLVRFGIPPFLDSSFDFGRMVGWHRQIWNVKFVCGVWAKFKLHPLHRSMFALIFADSTIPRWGWMKKTMRKINGECNQAGGALIAIELPSSSHYGYLGPSVLSRAHHNNWFTSQNHWSDTSSNARTAVIEKKLKALLNKKCSDPHKNRYIWDPSRPLLFYFEPQEISQTS